MEKPRSAGRADAPIARRVVRLRTGLLVNVDFMDIS
jgi:hypothetical protein